jgi:hypothetical protein
MAKVNMEDQEDAGKRISSTGTKLPVSEDERRKYE